MKKMKLRGFSFIELLFTCAIISILLLMSVPLANFLHQIIARNSSTTLFHSLQFARIEAIKRQQSVYICGTIDFIHCDHQQSKGYLIYTQLIANKTILRIERFAKDTNAFFPKHLTIHFSPNGQSHTPGAICIRSHGFSQKIVISTSGRIRMVS